MKKAGVIRKKKVQKLDEVPRGTDMAPLEKAHKVYAAKIAAEHAEPIVLQVRDLDHARSEEVLEFCLKELKDGTTYNALRIKLGCGTAAYDFRWREIRSLLTEMILPETEEDALLSANALSSYLLQRMEQFANKVKDRAEEMKGDKNEFQYLKLELDAMKILTEKYEARTEHYMKMKDLQKQEKGRHGQTVVFNNKFYIPRPGEHLQKEVGPTIIEAAQLASRLGDLENE